MFHEHVFIDHLSENFSIFYVNTADVLFIRFDLAQKEARNQENDDNEEHYKDLNLIVYVLQEFRERNSNSH